jgi:hypothetical protein
MPLVRAPPLPASAKGLWLLLCNLNQMGNEWLRDHALKGGWLFSNGEEGRARTRGIARNLGASLRQGGAMPHIRRHSRSERQNFNEGQNFNQGQKLIRG